MCTALDTAVADLFFGSFYSLTRPPPVCAQRDGSPQRRGSPTPSSRKGAMATRFTIAKQFKGQLDALMSTLNATDPHFIR